MDHVKDHLQQSVPVKNSSVETSQPTKIVKENSQPNKNTPSSEHHDYALPRVKENTPSSEHHDYALPRVSKKKKEQKSKEIPTSKLLQRSNLPKNCRFNNQIKNRYPLRSKFTSLGTNFKPQAADVLLAQHIFERKHQPYLMHVYRPDEKKKLLILF